MSETHEQKMLPVNLKSQGLFPKCSQVFTEKSQAGPGVTLNTKELLQEQNSQDSSESFQVAAAGACEHYFLAG